MRYAIVDFRINDEEKQNLINLGVEIILCPPCRLLYDSVCGHPDMQIHFIDKHTVIVHKDMNEIFINKLISIGLNVILSKNSLTDKYPEDIILNALNLPNLFVHNLKYTDKILLNNVQNKKLINVSQGYTKCSCAPVNKNAIITSDPSILKTLEGENIDILKIPSGDIILPGLDYGFIGGCCGILYNYMIFFGDLNYYAYSEKIINFLGKYNLKPIFLRKGKLIDRGSIFFIPEA